MDPTTFDALIKRLATTPLTRAHALRGLAASAVALAGVRLATEPGTANKQNRDEKEVRVCLWSAAGGRSKKVERSKAKQILRRNACARKGRCSGTNPCPAGVPVAGPGGPAGPTGPAGPAGPAGPGAALVCPAQCPACQTCNPATGQCEVCPLNCEFCFTLADRSTVCGGDAQAITCDVQEGGCTTSADCTEEPFIHCLASFTRLATNEVDRLCNVPPNENFFCTRIDPCA
jgi:hypothetical protein